MGDWTRPRAESTNLCGAVLALGKAAAARLTCRDGEEGFATLPATDQIPLAQLGEVFGARIEAFGTALTAAEVAGIEGPIARLIGLTANAQELVLLALAAGPSLDRGLDRVHHNLGRGERLTVGFLLDLAATSEETRLILSGALHPAASLRRFGLLTTSPGGVTSTTPVEVAPSVLTALRGDEIPVPEQVEEERLEIDSVLANDLAADFGLEPLRPGEMMLFEGPPPAARALARILAASWARAIWLAAETPDRRLLAWLRDATLTNALLAVDVDVAGSPIRTTLRRCHRLVARTDLALAGWSAHPVGPLPDDLADRIIRFDCARALDRDRLDRATNRLARAASAVAPMQACIDQLRKIAG